MTKAMTIKEMKAEISAYKRKNCPVLPTKKQELIKLCEKLGLRTTKADVKVYAVWNEKIPANLMPKTNYTKKQLIERITKKNGKTAAFYKKYSKSALYDVLEA